MELLGAPCHSGGAKGVRLVGSEVLVEDLLEAGEDVGVGFLAGYELAVVETVAVIEKQLNGRGDDDVAMRISSLADLIIDLAEAVNDGLALLQGEVKRLADIVGEEVIILDGASERGAAEQLGAEVEAPPLGDECGAVGGMAEHLARGDEDKGVFLEVVFMAAIGDIVGALHVLEVYDIHAEILAAVGDGAVDEVLVYHVDEGVTVGHAPQLVEVSHGGHVNNLVCRHCYFAFTIVVTNIANNFGLQEGIGKSCNGISNKYSWRASVRE